MARPELHTERLLLTPMRSEHLPMLIDLDSVSEVMRFILGRARSTAEARRFWAPRCSDARADERDLGWWVEFSEGEFVGWWVLALGGIDATPAEGATVAEAGWRLGRAWWGRGLATEGADAVLRWGFEHAGLEMVWAEVHPENVGSRGVLRHLGTQRVEATHDDDEAADADLRHEVTRTQWERDRRRS